MAESKSEAKRTTNRSCPWCGADLWDFSWFRMQGKIDCEWVEFECDACDKPVKCFTETTYTIQQVVKR
jgi:hypothetical protein